MDIDFGKAPDADLTVLIIDSDQDSCTVISAYLDRRGIRTHCVASGTEGLAAARSLSPDIILIDPELSHSNGYAIVRLLARRGDCGVVILSRSGEPTDRITGLEVGADDYICKPAATRELLARIRAVHRRASKAATPYRTQIQLPPVRNAAPCVVKRGAKAAMAAIAL